MRYKWQAITTRFVGAAIFAGSLFVVGPVFGVQGTLGVVMMTLGLVMASMYGYGRVRR